MAAAQNKLKLLYLTKALLEESAEQHTLSAADLMNILKRYGLTADRKTIYNDIAALQNVGMDIVRVNGANGGYYVGQRDFELPELKLLVDAVQASKFITGRKSQELIGKLEKLTNQYDAKQLQRDVVIFNRPKTENETIYYNVDQIHSAISTKKQITFQYLEWTADKVLRPKRNGAWYQVSPCALIWDDQNYYLVGYDHHAEKRKHFRVDKMRNTTIMKELCCDEKQVSQFDPVAFSKKTFGMYGGTDEHITLRCENQLVGVILDRFGTETMLIPDREGHFTATIEASVSAQFFGWLAGIGKGIEIVFPKFVREEYAEHLRGLLAGMETDTAAT